MKPIQMTKNASARMITNFHVQEDVEALNLSLTASFSTTIPVPPTHL